MASIDARHKAIEICMAALDKKAEDVIIMDMRAVTDITDYFVIASASSTKRVQAVASGVEEALFRRNISYWHIEGKKEALWVLMDYGDVIVHIFFDEMRRFYNLERLWNDAPREEFRPSSTRCKSGSSKKI